VAPPLLVEYLDPMSRFPGAEIGADELPDEVHLMADRIESITGKDVYFIDGRRHRFDTGQLPPGMPPPPVSGPPAGPDIVVFVNPEGTDPQLLSASIRRFLVQALLVWEGYPLAGLRQSALDPAATAKIAPVIGPMQHWLHTGLLAMATELRMAELASAPPEPRRASRLPPFQAPPDVRAKLVAFESAMGASVHDGPLSPEARAVTEVLQKADLGTPAGFRAAFAGILDLWDIRGHVMLGVADKESGAISESAW